MPFLLPPPRCVGCLASSDSEEPGLSIPPCMELSKELLVVELLEELAFCVY